MSTTETAWPLDQIIDVPLSALKTNPWNPRSITPERLEALKRSMKEDPDGLRDRPCIALPDGTVIAGNMRLLGANELLADGDERFETIPCVFHAYDDAKAKLVALRDNGSWGDWEDDGLAELLKELQARDVDLALTGFADDDLTRLFEALEEPAPPPEDRGTDLSIADVSIGDPIHVCETGDVWKVGAHLLVVEGVYDGWEKWIGYLDDPSVLLVPYPTPTLPLTVRASNHRLVMVQPDRWLAAHVLDKFAAVRGAESVEKVS